MPRRPKGTNALVDYFGEALRRSLHVERGRFGAYMHVSLASEGPFPIWLEV